ncbi:hypothetical protein SAMN02745784_02914 [Tissierella praeacuta DSM 18095]|uniref:Uncharacterized protein n=1 Tax=Tissierella praeacuta DSM 18095 TaxID=1123404 RepID=A0A1M4Z5Q6_9FIRM|nr:hypothetical protein [Tissierella praeacuta]SHF13361.1 hypothetical protein SAMN02745784_02914 [Tissierella praeacuta DSM 18095]SUP00611.1 Uncharacterised protein [Tissierella praeacuta]
MIEVLENPIRETIGDRIATIVEINEDGLPIIQFDGEEEPSQKLYPISGLFKPEKGQRVMMKRFNDTYIIEYNILYLEVMEEPNRNNFEGNVNIDGDLKVDDINSRDINCRDITVTRRTNIDNLSVTGKLDLDSDLNIMGDTTLNKTFINDELSVKDLKVLNTSILTGLKIKGPIGFFEANPTNRKSIDRPVGTNWNLYAVAIAELLDILEEYGLIQQKG